MQIEQPKIIKDDFLHIEVTYEKFCTKMQELWVLIENYECKELLSAEKLREEINEVFENTKYLVSEDKIWETYNQAIPCAVATVNNDDLTPEQRILFAKFTIRLINQH